MDLMKIHFYYLYDLCTFSDYDQTQILMNPVYKQKGINTHFSLQISQQVFGVVAKE